MIDTNSITADIKKTNNVVRSTNKKVNCQDNVAWAFERCKIAIVRWKSTRVVRMNTGQGSDETQ